MKEDCVSILINKSTNKRNFNLLAPCGRAAMFFFVFCNDGGKAGVSSNGEGVIWSLSSVISNVPSFFAGGDFRLFEMVSLFKGISGLIVECVLDDSDDDPEDWSTFLSTNDVFFGVLKLCC
jgi:hypothetical protein